MATATQVMSYGVSLYTSSGITNPSDAVGTPNTVAASGSGSTARVETRVALGLDWSTITPVRVRVGCRYYVSGSTAANQVRLYMLKGDTTSKYVTPAAISTWYDVEVDLDPVRFTAAEMSDPLADVIGVGKGVVAGTLYVDAMWMKVDYYQPSDVLWSPPYYALTNTAVTGSWTNPANAVGAPNGTYATATSASSSEISGRYTMDTASIPDGDPLLLVAFGVYGRVSQAGNGTNYVRTGLPPDWATVADNNLPVTMTTTDSSIEIGATYPWTREQLRGMSYRFCTTSNGTQSKTTYVDALWVRFLTARSAPAQVTSKYWDGSTWVTTTPKRWDGTQWVSASSVKRWDGSQWVGT